MQIAAEVYSGALEAGTSRVLEEIAFAFVEPGDPGAPFDGDAIVAEIPFRGPETGRIVLAVPRGFAAELAANMLGDDGDQPDDAGAGAVLEILNMLGGIVMEEAYGSDVPTCLELPVVVDAAPAALAALAGVAAGSSLVVADDEHTVRTLLMVDPVAPGPCGAADPGT